MRTAPALALLCVAAVATAQPAPRTVRARETCATTVHPLPTPLADRLDATSPVSLALLADGAFVAFRDREGQLRLARADDALEPRGDVRVLAAGASAFSMTATRAGVALAWVEPGNSLVLARVDAENELENVPRLLTATRVPIDRVAVTVAGEDLAAAWSAPRGAGAFALRADARAVPRGGAQGMGDGALLGLSWLSDVGALALTVSTPAGEGAWVSLDDRGREISRVRWPVGARGPVTVDGASWAVLLSATGAPVLARAAGIVAATETPPADARIDAVLAREGRAVAVVQRVAASRQGTLHLRVSRHRRHAGAQRFPHRRGRGRRGEDAAPDVVLAPGKAFFQQRRRLRKLGEALRPPAGQHAQPAVPDMRRHRAWATGQRLHLAGQQRRQRRGAALEGHVQQLHLGRRRQHGHGHMQRRVIARGRIADRPRPALRIRQEVVQILPGRGRRHHQEGRVRGEQRNRRQLVQLIGRGAPEQPRRFRQHGQGGQRHQQRMPIRRRPGDEAVAEFARGAGAIDHRHRLLPQPLQPRRHRPRHHIRLATRWKGDDHGERVVRKRRALRQGGQCRQRRQQGTSQQPRLVAHSTGFSSTPMPATSTRTTSPFFRNTGGLKPMPTPTGVPVAITSPGSSVM